MSNKQFTFDEHQRLVLGSLIAHSMNTGTDCLDDFFDELCREFKDNRKEWLIVSIIDRESNQSVFSEVGKRYVLKVSHI
jgi:hypothetical protein